MRLVADGRLHLRAGLLTLVMLLGTVVACTAETGTEEEPLRYRVVDSVCGLEPVGLFATSTPVQESAEAGAGRTYVICKLRMDDPDADPRERGELTIVATIFDDPSGALNADIDQRRSDAQRSPGETVGCEPQWVDGIGESATWCDHSAGNPDDRRIRLIGHDDNLFYEIAWRVLPPNRQYPADIVARLYELAGALLNLTRVPGTGAPATAAAIPAPTVTGRASLPYSPVNDLCAVADFASLGGIASGTTASHTRQDTVLGVFMSCVVELIGRRAASIGVTVHDDLDTARQQSADRQSQLQGTPYSLGAGAFFFGSAGQLGLAVYDGNLYLEINYTGGANVASDAADELAVVAESVMAGMRTP